MMRKSSVEEITVTDWEGVSSKTFEEDEDYIFSEIQHLGVVNMSVTKDTSIPDAPKAEVKFKNGLIYKIYVTEESLLINSNHTDTNLIYDMYKERYAEIINNYAIGKIVARAAKPVIYLYPEEKTDCTVKLGYPRLTYTYPTYNDDWNVTAYPDGKLTNKADGSEHYYLFWEGNEIIDWDFSQGFVVKGSDTENFLKEKLSYMGLNPREYNDFITYWVPRLKFAKYNLITFSGEQYENLAPLTVTPKPDSVLRINMVFKHLEKPIKVKEQKLKPFERKGFTVVEWGGTDANI